ncbi:MAG: hypothetical protein M1812_002971 [Candelaria pacifica]|nr:MAG: hypothetical protein M1812_002971 [Candelaria pacifica]
MPPSLSPLNSPPHLTLIQFILILISSLTLYTTAHQTPLKSNPSKNSNAAENSPLSTPEFETLVNSSLKKWHVPGLTVAVVEGERTFMKGYGHASFPSTPTTPKTLFYTASTTKAFTAAAISLLIDSQTPPYRDITWTTPLSTLIREDFVLSDPYLTSQVTIADALSHRTGLPRHDFSYGGRNATVRDVVRSLRFLTVTEPLRTRFLYCNIMYVAVSHAIETVTGMWLGDFLRERIWHPLGMRSTFFSLADAERYAEETESVTLAEGYYWDNKSESYGSVPYVDETVASGAGATISSVADYAHWLRAMIQRSGPISASAHAELVSVHSLPAPKAPSPFVGVNGYGFGWQIDVYRGEELITHGGGVDGFGALVAYLPRRGWGCVMMANAAETSGVVQQTLAFKLIDDVLDVPLEERVDWDEQSERGMRLIKMMLKTAKERLYPSIPDPPLPHSLSLEKYQGTYSHPAYQNYTVVLAASLDPKLPFQLTSVVTQDERMFSHSLTLEHISGDNFLAWVNRPGVAGNEGSEDALLVALRVEFEVGVDGKVKTFGVHVEDAGPGQGTFTKFEWVAESHDAKASPEKEPIYTGKLQQAIATWFGGLRSGLEVVFIGKRSDAMNP